MVSDSSVPFPRASILCGGLREWEWRALLRDFGRGINRGFRLSGAAQQQQVVG
jgi:hypothetical protein